METYHFSDNLPPKQQWDEFHRLSARNVDLLMQQLSLLQTAVHAIQQACDEIGLLDTDYDSITNEIMTGCNQTQLALAANESLSKLASALNPIFTHCHRAFIVNV